MNIVLAQLNPIPADIEYNKNKIIEALDNQEYELMIFPKYFIYGYHNFDMIEKFAKSVKRCIVAEELAPHIETLIKSKRPEDLWSLSR